MKLSDRLQLIANQIEKGETMADIGTDHGFLPIYLWENHISPKVIMCDISQGSLSKAVENCTDFYPGKEFDFRLGSGIDVIDNGEVDVAVIAGMGGILISEILEKDLKKSYSINKYILQPRNNVGRLRFWLLHNNFEISKELLVRESRFIWEILVVKPKKELDNHCSEDKFYFEDEPSFEYEFPHTLIDFNDPLTREYLENKLKTEIKIEENIRKKGKDSNEKLTIIGKKIKYIETLIKELR